MLCSDWRRSRPERPQGSLVRQKLPDAAQKVDCPPLEGLPSFRFRATGNLVSGRRMVPIPAAICEESRGARSKDGSTHLFRDVPTNEACREVGILEPEPVRRKTWTRKTHRPTARFDVETDQGGGAYEGAVLRACATPGSP